MLSERITGVGGSSLPPGEVCRAIGHPCRRAVIDVLRGEDEPVSLRYLAEEVAALETEQQQDVGVRRAEISLYHNHLRKLDSADVIEWDGDMAKPGPELHSVGASLDALRDILD